jgi:hypothetical protein
LTKVTLQLTDWPKWAYNLRIDQSDLTTYGLTKVYQLAVHWKYLTLYWKMADPIGRAVWSVGLRLLAHWNSGFKFSWGHGCLSLGECCVLSVEVSASGWSLVQGSPAKCVRTCTIECDCEALTVRRPWPTRGCYAMGGKKYWKMAKLLLAACTHFLVCAFTLNGLLTFNPVKADLNPIHHLLALLGAHHILHISRIRVNSKYHDSYTYVHYQLLGICTILTL